MYKMKQELEIYNKKLYKIINDQIRKIYEEQKNVIIALMKICITKDPSIAIHLERVGKNSRMLAMSLQLSANYREGITNCFVDIIEIAAYLHDLGKIALADSIVYNIDYINAEEKEIMKTHTTIGANILESIASSNEHNEFIKMAADIARYHHENWDGSGYPTGLSGTAIPLSARIVSIIDAYDLLINSQTSKQSLSHESSMDIINKGSGILFDPDIITVFGKIQNQLKR
jgi:putative two-component system response regulator